MIFFRKHVVFGHVVSGQPVVDAIESVSVDSNSRPLKNVVIAHCGQLVLVSSRFKLLCSSSRLVWFCLEETKKKKRKISTEEESENEQGSGSGGSSDDEGGKKKKKSKHKKKEKHRRKKESKRLAKLSAEEENQPDQPANTIVEKSNEISGKDMMGLKTNIDPGEIPEIPEHKFLLRRDLNENNNNNNPAPENR